MTPGLDKVTLYFSGIHQDSINFQKSNGLSDIFWFCDLIYCNDEVALDFSNKYYLLAYIGLSSRCHTTVWR